MSRNVLVLVLTMGRMSLSPLRAETSLYLYLSWAECPCLLYEQKRLCTCHGKGHVSSIGIVGDTLDSLGLALWEGARDPVAHGVVLQPEHNGCCNGYGSGNGTDYGFGYGSDYGFTVVLVMVKVMVLVK
jgi:hypothetical protein